LPRLQAQIQRYINTNTDRDRNRNTRINKANTELSRVLTKAVRTLFKHSLNVKSIL